ncbi:MAG: hypothetical protein ACPGSD_03955 [Flavobacteriales bacterium]
MKPKIKKVVDELMNYNATFNFNEAKKEQSIFRIIHEKYGFSEIVSRLNKLLRWIDPFYHKSYYLQDGSTLNRLKLFSDLMEPEDKEEVYEEFKNIFKYCPELNKLFVLNSKFIRFNSSLSPEDIQEIYDYVSEINKRGKPLLYYNKSKK